MNIPLLRKIAAVIQEKPEKFDMNDWQTDKSCGTAYCIGGWACHFTGTERFDFSAAKNALQIDLDQGDRLFYCHDWPEQFQGTYDSWSPTPQQAAARIEHFIATNGAE